MNKIIIYVNALYIKKFQIIILIQFIQRIYSNMPYLKIVFVVGSISNLKEE